MIFLLHLFIEKALENVFSLSTLYFLIVKLSFYFPSFNNVIYIFKDKKFFFDNSEEMLALLYSALDGCLEK